MVTSSKSSGWKHEVMNAALARGVPRSTVLFAGDVTYDMYVMISHIPAPDEKLFTSGLRGQGGGVVANAAAACAVAGTPSRALLQIADDVFAIAALSLLRTLGVEVVTEVVSGSTTLCTVLIEPHGEKRLLLTPGVSMYPSPSQSRGTDLAEIGWMHSAIYDEESCSVLVQRCREMGIPFSLDLEPATLASIEDLSKFVDGAAVLFCNTQSARLLGPDAAELLFQKGANAVVFTDGPKGARWVESNSSHHVTPPPGAILDTTGAGDCLAGSLVARLMQGASPEEALAYAVAAATIACAAVGAQSSYEVPQVVNAVLNTAYWKEIL